VTGFVDDQNSSTAGADVDSKDWHRPNFLLAAEPHIIRLRKCSKQCARPKKSVPVASAQTVRAAGPGKMNRILPLEGREEKS
jgi:hypothetical protein